MLQGEVILIKIFLASSSELKSDREQFVNYVNDKLNHMDDIKVRFERWEYFEDAFVKEGLQSKYNEAAVDSDFFVSLFHTKVGPYTQDEFSNALNSYIEKDRPLVFTYFKDESVKLSEINKDDILSLFSFKERLKGLKHYPTYYDNIDALLRKFSDQLDKYIPKLRSQVRQWSLSASISSAPSSSGSVAAISEGRTMNSQTDIKLVNAPSLYVSTSKDQKKRFNDDQINTIVYAISDTDNFQKSVDIGEVLKAGVTKFDFAASISGILNEAPGKYSKEQVIKFREVISKFNAVWNSGEVVVVEESIPAQGQSAIDVRSQKSA